MRRSTLLWVALPLALGGAVYYARVSGEWHSAVAKAGWYPSADFPAVIDLGPYKLGEVVEAKFAIANRGGGILAIDQIIGN